MADSDRDDIALREMAEELEKELTVTQQLLKIARLYHRSTWPGERDAAAEAFARVASGTPWQGLSPGQFLRSARRPTPDPEPVSQPEPEAQPQSPCDQAAESHQDERAGASKWSRLPSLLSQNRHERTRFGIIAVLVIACIGGLAGLAQAPVRSPSQLAAQTQAPSSDSHAGAAQVIALPAPESDADVVAAPPQPQPVLQVDTPLLPRSVKTSAVSLPAPPEASSAPLTPERQAEFILHDLLRAWNTGDISGLGAYYSNTINYYGKRMGKSDVIADKARFMERWQIRNYIIKPDTLTTTCYVLGHGSGRVSCDIKGLMDWEAANSSKRSNGTTSFTYTFESRSDPLDLRIAAENSTVITRNVAVLGQGQ